MMTEKIPQAAEAILRVDSPDLEPYIESIRHVCENCELRNADGSCDLRSTDQCMLNTEVYRKNPFSTRACCR